MNRRALAITVTAIILVASIITLILGGVHFALKKDSSPAYTDYVNRPYTYSDELYLKYINAMESVVGEGGTSTIKDYSLLRDRIWRAFKNGRVSADVVARVVDEITSTDWSDDGETANFIKKLTELKKDESNTLDVIIDPVAVSEAIESFFLFIDKTHATIDELGRFLYAFITDESLGTADENFYKITEDDFTLLTVGTVSVTRLYRDYDLSSLSAARTLSQTISSLGYAYRRIIKNVGKNNVKNLIGLNLIENMPLENLGEEYRDEYRDRADVFVGDFGTIFEYVAEIMVNLPYEFFEELYDYEALKNTSSPDDATIVFAYKRLSDEVMPYIEELSASLEEGSAEKYLATYYASAKRVADLLYGRTNNDYNADYDAARDKISAMISAMKILAEAEEDTIDELKCSENYSTYFDSALYLYETDFDYAEALTYVVSGITIAAVASWA